MMATDTVRSNTRSEADDNASYLLVVVATRVYNDPRRASPVILVTKGIPKDLDCVDRT